MTVTDTDTDTTMHTPPEATSRQPNDLIVAVPVPVQRPTPPMHRTSVNSTSGPNPRISFSNREPVRPVSLIREESYGVLPGAASTEQLVHGEISPRGTTGSTRPVSGLVRSRSLIRPERVPRPVKLDPSISADEVADGWRICSWISTCWAFPIFLKWAGMPDYHVQQAWREKVTLVILVILLCGVLAFITFGFNVVLCTAKLNSFKNSDIEAYTYDNYPGRYVIRGGLYDFGVIRTQHAGFAKVQALSSTIQEKIDKSSGRDVSVYFPPSAELCSRIAVKSFSLECATSDFDGVKYCHQEPLSGTVMTSMLLGEVAFDWAEIQSQEKRKLIAYNSAVIDVTKYISENNTFLGQWVHDTILASVGTDASMRFGANDQTKEAAKCLVSLYGVGTVDTETIGCFISDIVLNVALVTILAVVMIRFVLAIAFNWFMSRELGRLQEKRRKLYGRNPNNRSKASSIVRRRRSETGSGAETPNSNNMSRNSSVSNLSALDAVDLEKNIAGGVSQALENSGGTNIGTLTRTEEADLRNIHTLMLVTCYSEGEASLRCTLDSLASTDYPDEFKLLIVIADGLITGSGNPKSTPDLLLDMIELDPHLPNPPEALSYIAIADGAKRHNKAKVYVGVYRCGEKSVNTILIVKCGTEEEQKAGVKPGNRGKRDSQVILMNFFQKVIFDELMSPLEYDLFRKIHRLAKVTPDVYEIVLMVDADTKVYTDSLTRMVLCMARDPQVMGLCGETRIANKSDTWVTRIQVFEYHISHHLGKAFESIFGGVTCLPGCFCMYRIKAPKGEGNFWVPIIANPAIIEEYRVNVVDTLHKKNLLLLGEDRYLTTLMLRTFPKRKMLFVPKAVCKTVVPDQFSILLSQRRRWINSTIHNLFELLFVRELCGTFCFSMQFIVFLELIGTLTLPAAITFTTVLIIVTIIGPIIPIVPLLLLFAILGLPAFLILFTTRKTVYIYWMAVYLLALPIWNFALPSYAYWHFDDFSWGQTRKVAGEGAGDDHSKKEGEFDVTSIPVKKWADWERDRRKIMARLGPAGKGIWSMTEAKTTAWDAAGPQEERKAERKDLTTVEIGE